MEKIKAGNGRDLEWLLDYEVKQSRRHRRFVSLVMFSANGNTNTLDSLLEGVVRDSDPLFFLSHAIAVIMGETDTAGAQKAIDRYRKMVSNSMDVKYAVASFPEDGKAPEDLIQTARCRLNNTDKLP